MTRYRTIPRHQRQPYNRNEQKARLLEACDDLDEILMAEELIAPKTKVLYCPICKQEEVFHYAGSWAELNPCDSRFNADHYICDCGESKMVYR